MQRIARAYRRLLNPVTYALSQPKPFAVIFVHIPKCGGTTVNNHFYDNYHPRRICELYVPGRHAPDGRAITIDTTGIPELDEFRDRLSQYQREYDCVLGHMPYGVHRFFDRPCRYVTLLRDPVKRVWSSINALSNLPEHYLHQRLVDLKDNWHRIITSDWGFLFRNDQARMLLGTPEVNLTASDIPRALEHLKKHYWYVAMTETFDLDIQQIGRQLGWRRRPPQKWNVGRYRKHPPHPPEELISLIREHNTVDQALFDHVLSLRNSRTHPQPVS